ncbi:Spermidine-binding periplasmic protein SpuE [compost metagenome]
MLAIPADAKNVVEAHQFVDFVLDPKNIAQISEFTGYANANLAANALMPKSLLDDPAVYPSKDTITRCFTSIELPPKLNRWVTRAWTNLKSGS